MYACESYRSISHLGAKPALVSVSAVGACPDVAVTGARIDVERTLEVAEGCDGEFVVARVWVLHVASSCIEISTYQSTVPEAISAALWTPTRAFGVLTSIIDVFVAEKVTVRALLGLTNIIFSALAVKCGACHRIIGILAKRCQSYPP